MPVQDVPVPGSPIRSAWAQSVSAVANTGENTIATKVAKTGDVLTGPLSWGGDPIDAQGLQLRLDGVIRSTNGSTTLANIRLARGGAGAIDPGQSFMTFVRGLTSSAPVIGSITIATASTVAYNTSSDARLKEPTGDVADAAAIVQALGSLAYRGRWKDDIAEGIGEEWVFVNSQDVQLLAPFAVTGEPDAVTTQDDVDAGLAGEPGQIIPQQLNHGALVPLLLAALAQALDRIDTLEAAR
jgi:hypothetical protein